MGKASATKVAAAAIGALVLASAGLGPALSQDAAHNALPDLVQAGDRAAALALIDDGADVNAAQANATTALHWAAYNGDVDLATRLIEAGADADVTNVYGATPLGEAVNVANTALVALLLDAGADPNAPNAEGQTALMLATRTGVPPIAELLVAHGADVNAQEAWKGQTALMWAAADNQVEMVAFLLDQGAAVDVRAEANDWGRQVTSEPRAQYRPTGGMTALLYAARVGCLECVAAMLDAGAEIDLPNPDGVTPLMAALDNFNFDTAALLIERGAATELWDWWGRTPLYIAIDVNTYRGTGGFGGGGGVPEDPDQEHAALDIAAMLLDRGADPNIQLALHRPDRAGQGRFVDDALRTGATPLLRAALTYDVEAIALLLDHGAEVDLPNVMGLTPLMMAAGMGVSSRDMRGYFRNADHDALQDQSIAALEVLLAAGADVNARVLDTQSWTARIARLNTMTDRDGQTAIYATVGWGWDRVAAYLIANGARLDIVDAHGKSPLDAARGDAGGRPERLNDETVAVIETAVEAL